MDTLKSALRSRIAWFVALVIAGSVVAGTAGVVTVGSKGAEAREGRARGHQVRNHGRCVSFWAHEAKRAGLRGPAREAFMEKVSGDRDAVAPKMAKGAGRHAIPADASRCASYGAELDAAVHGAPPDAKKPKGSDGAVKEQLDRKAPRSGDTLPPAGRERDDAERTREDPSDEGSGQPDDVIDEVIGGS